MKRLQELVRKNIWELKPYSSARDEFKGEASVFLDANENPFRENYNRYPDPLQWKLKEKISKIKEIEPEKIFLGNGSDEPIDVLIRVFCEPRVDNIVAIEPTYGMYQICSEINDVEYRKVRLNEDFSLDANRVLAATDQNTKVIFLCSPNNPTANILKRKEIDKILVHFDGIVVVDEAYIDFAANESHLPELNKFPNLIILQTFSKAWGLAAVRLGVAFAMPEIIKIFNKVKYPYNVNQLTQDFVSTILDNDKQKNIWVKEILTGRDFLHAELKKISYIEKVYPSDANFVLIKVKDAKHIYNILSAQGIIVRNRNSVAMCENCLRITVGTESENKLLINSMKAIKF